MLSITKTMLTFVIIKQINVSDRLFFYEHLIKKINKVVKFIEIKYSDNTVMFLFISVLLKNYCLRLVYI